MTEVKTVVETVESVPVTLIGTGDGNGAPLSSGVTAITPDHLPNLIINIVSPIRAIVIRFLNQFFTSLFGLVGAGLAGSERLHAPDFWHLVLICSSLSVAGAGVALIKDLVTIFGKLEGKYPLSTGSI